MSQEIIFGLASVVTTDRRVPGYTDQGGPVMEHVRFTLCPLCAECPEAVITDQQVTIGEDANMVRLSHAEWNELVALIKRGDLREI